MNILQYALCQTLLAVGAGVMVNANITNHIPVLTEEEKLAKVTKKEVQQEN